MKKTKRLWALLLVMVMALGLITTAFAAPTIDSGRKASLSLYKYDITAASADGAWDAASYGPYLLGKLTNRCPAVGVNPQPVGN